LSLIRSEDWVLQGVETLEDRAWLALRETGESVCVTAGAGAGKTEFLAQKATYLLQTGLCPAPKRILAISFKRDAAQTLGDRVRTRCPEQQARRFVSSTFDAFTKGLVDQFRMALPEPFRPPADYEISFPTQAIVTDFLQRANINTINPGAMQTLVANVKLPLDAEFLDAEQRRALNAYWTDQLRGGPRAFLTFQMINRLAEQLVRTNQQVRRVLQLTYPIVFLDEFQDVTDPQFEMLMSAFATVETRFTAVGDDKQRIMGWAGAMADAFDTFTARCNARRIALLLNWRSNPELVRIQHVIAQRIDPAVEEPQARRALEVNGDVSAIWEYPSTDAEIDGIANWIAGEISNGLIADRIAVLVRNNADRVADELAPALAERGVILRNIARNVGDIAIQDLLSEELTGLVIPILRLGATNRDPQAWGIAIEQLRKLYGADENDDLAQSSISKRLSNLTRQIRQSMRQLPPTAAAAAIVANLAIVGIDEMAVRRASPTYFRDSDYARVREGFVLLLQESSNGAGSWTNALDRFEGQSQVALMTVHKSKGMEFHTMIFFGLDGQSWWSLTPNRIEELKSFFVAFTRAEQRAFFTSCLQRGNRIAWLENILAGAVARIVGPV
jgi:superfamily I DNA/RNA helicase